LCRLITTHITTLTVFGFVNGLRPIHDTNRQQLFAVHDELTATRCAVIIRHREPTRAAIDPALFGPFSGGLAFNLRKEFLRACPQAALETEK
jgi:hypothetical protein